MKKHTHSAADLVKTQGRPPYKMRCVHCKKSIVKGKKTSSKAFGKAKILKGGEKIGV